MLKVILIVFAAVNGQEPHTEAHEMASISDCYKAAQLVMAKNKPSNPGHAFGAGCVVTYDDPV